MYYFPRMNVPAIVKTLVITILLSLVMLFGLSMTLLPLVLSGIISEERLEESIPLNAAFYSLGIIFDVFSGYLVGVFARRHVLHHAFVVGLVFFVLGAAILLIPAESPYPMADWISQLLIIPLALLGGYIYLQIQKRLVRTRLDKIESVS